MTPSMEFGSFRQKKIRWCYEMVYLTISVRSQGFTPSQRFDPIWTLWWYFTPQPPLGLWSSECWSVQFAVTALDVQYFHGVCEHSHRYECSGIPFCYQYLLKQATTSCSSACASLWCGLPLFTNRAVGCLDPYRICCPYRIGQAKTAEMKTFTPPKSFSNWTAVFSIKEVSPQQKTNTLLIFSFSEGITTNR